MEVVNKKTFMNVLSQGEEHCEEYIQKYGEFKKMTSLQIELKNLFYIWKHYPSMNKFIESAVAQDALKRLSVKAEENAGNGKAAEKGDEKDE